MISKKSPHKSSLEIFVFKVSWAQKSVLKKIAVRKYVVLVQGQNLQENYLIDFAQVTLNLWAINDEQKCKKPTRNLSKNSYFFLKF